MPDAAMTAETRAAPMASAVAIPEAVMGGETGETVANPGASAVGMPEAEIAAPATFHHQSL
jgi:hypothetical protein